MGEHTQPSIQFEPHNGFGANDPNGEPWPFGYISTAPLPLPIFELRPTLAFTPKEFLAYAALIVRAVNSHGALVDALFNQTETLCHKCESAGCINLKIRNAREILAKVSTPEQTK